MKTTTIQNVVIITHNGPKLVIRLRTSLKSYLLDKISLWFPHNPTLNLFNF